MFGGGDTVISNSAPRIGAMRIQTSQYGGVLPIVYGLTRIAGNLIYYGNFIATANTTTTTTGGKGGPTITQSNTTYTYTADLEIALCEGPIQGFGRVWVLKNLTTLGAMNAQPFYGSDPQAPWAYAATPQQYRDSNGLTYAISELGALYIKQNFQGFMNVTGVTYPQFLARYTALGDGIITYPGIAYIAMANYQLLSSAELPNHSFEIYGRLPFNAYGVYDAEVTETIRDLLTNYAYGVGIPVGVIGDWSEARNYCRASGIFISPALTSTRPAHEWIRDWLRTANCDLFFSEGLLKIRPYGDTVVGWNAYSFTPNLTPVYDITDDDYILDNHDPVLITRKMQADAFNSVKIEYVERASSYNIDIAEAQDQGDIALNGLRTMSMIKANEITTGTLALQAAQRILQRQLYIRNLYEFSVGWRFALLEPMDLVTITDANLGLTRQLIRVVSVEEDESGHFKVVAEEMSVGTAHAALFSRQTSLGFKQDYNEAASNTAAPAVFEAPLALAPTGLEVWIAVAGSTITWGGCEIWVSTDDATYKKLARVTAPSRYGVLAAALAAGGDPDTVNTLSVDLTRSFAQLVSGTQDDADNARTLCYVDGEFLSYQTAALVQNNGYNLTYLRRGQYGSIIAAHGVGSAFVRCDADVLIRYPFDAAMIGRRIYIKTLSFNRYGGGRQNLSDVHSTTYTIQGTALSAPLANAQNVVSLLRDNRVLLRWDVVTDPLRAVTYEVRKGASWAKGQISAALTVPEYVVDGDGTYWISAKGGTGYSATPTSIVISGSRLSPNIVQTWDEAATSWSGTLAGSATVVSATVQLTGSAVISSAGSMSGITPSVLAFGGIGATGTYEIPAGHVVDVGTVQTCNVSCTYAYTADSPFALFSNFANVRSQASIGGAFAGKATVQIQIAVSNLAGTFGAWQNFVTGQYTGRKFKLRAVLATTDATVTAILSAFSWTVDMPDRVDRQTGVAIAAGGTAVTWATPFQIVPNVQITITNAVAGDDVTFTVAPTTTGATIKILNGGVGVARTVNVLTQGY